MNDFCGQVDRLRILIRFALLRSFLPSAITIGYMKQLILNLILLFCSELLLAIFQLRLEVWYVLFHNQRGAWYQRKLLQCRAKFQSVESCIAELASSKSDCRARITFLRVILRKA